MKSEISALLDDELDEATASRALDALRRDRELREAWGVYHLIGDALRRTPGCSPDFTARVMARLTEEPVVLRPAAPARSPAPRFALALAAAVTGMGVVAWLALSLHAPQSMETAAAPRLSATEVTASAPPGTDGLKVYIVAHQAHSPSGRMQGAAAAVRTVAEIRQGTRP